MTRRSKEHQTKIPHYEIETLARYFLPDIQAYFESEEGKREFAEWKSRQGQLKQLRKGGEDNDST